ncbi:hypothetical protein [Leptolyngbya sp. PCC 6406]|uniref:hypothetical protein n=1 Tax=Leptolyngbya sp. PCC 6406 TaxID=1173264 RepID=UPI0002AC5591|nr:hypothetical protein [Leptolyngbya sp. PCC 6406]
MAKPSTRRPQRRPTAAAALAKLGLHSPLDLLHHYPKRHEHYEYKPLEQIQAGECVTVIGSLVHHSIRPAKQGQLIVQRWAIASRDHRHRLLCTHFHKAEPPYTSPAWQRQQQQ